MNKIRGSPFSFSSYSYSKCTHFSHILAKIEKLLTRHLSSNFWLIGKLYGQKTIWTKTWNIKLSCRPQKLEILCLKVEITAKTLCPFSYSNVNITRERTIFAQIFQNLARRPTLIFWYFMHIIEKNVVYKRKLGQTIQIFEIIWCEHRNMAFFIENSEWRLGRVLLIVDMR